VVVHHVCAGDAGIGGDRRGRGGRGGGDSSKFLSDCKILCNTDSHLSW
jgi:hypothetical protein